MGSQKNSNSKPKLQSLLSGYGSDDSSASGHSDDEDSEQELKYSLSKKKKEFSYVKDEILEFCAEETANYKAKEKQWLSGNKSSSKSRSQTPQSTRKRNRSVSSSDSKSSNLNHWHWRKLILKRKPVTDQILKSKSESINSSRDGSSQI